VRGFILAAGFGTRLRPLTDHVPKALVKVAGTPLLGHALYFFKEHGIQTIGVNTHYLPEQIEKYSSESEIAFVQFHEEGKIRGTGGALHFARNFLVGDTTFVVANADIIARYQLSDALQKFEQSDAICMLVAFPAIGGGTIFYDQSTGEYLGTPGGPLECMSKASADFIGTAFYRREFLGYVQPEDFSVVPIWLRAAQNGAKVIVHIISDGFWRDVGSPQALLDIHCEIIDGKITLPLPANMLIDTAKKRCLHTSVKETEQIGEYSWIESPHFPNSTCSSRVLCYADVKKIHETNLNNAIVTEWGVLPAS
jgi:mannose-1-phosphate guanylyltransferase